MGTLADLTVLESVREGRASRARVSVIVPVGERPEPLRGLYEEFAAALRQPGWTYEFLFVCEPYHAAMADSLADLVRTGEPIRVLRAAQPLGEAALLKLGAQHATAPVVVTLPAYRRVAASSLPGLVERVEAGADLVVARRWPRRDSWINRVQNRIFHGLLRRVADPGVRDVACGVRAMRRDLLLEISLYGDFFRFLPLLAWRDGYRVEEQDAPQHERDRQPRVYSPGVYVRRLLDILGIYFLLRFTHKPLRFFGLIGGASAAGGGVILSVLFVQRMGGQALADRPLLLLGVLLLVLGVQAIALGLVGEIIVHLHAATIRTYRVADDSLEPRATTA